MKWRLFRTREVPRPPSGIGVFIASRGIIDGRGACIEVACIIYHGGEVDL